MGRAFEPRRNHPNFVFKAESANFPPFLFCLGRRTLRPVELLTKSEIIEILDTKVLEFRDIIIIIAVYKRAESGFAHSKV